MYREIIYKSAKFNENDRHIKLDPEDIILEIRIDKSDNIDTSSEKYKNFLKYLSKLPKHVTQIKINVDYTDKSLFEAIKGAIPKEVIINLTVKQEELPSSPKVINEKKEASSINDEITRIMNAKNHYEVLGIEKKATENEIRGAYLKLIKLLHPDHNPNIKTDDATTKINGAYEVLR